jgi:hypothetical protein
MAGKQGTPTRRGASLVASGRLMFVAGKSDLAVAISSAVITVAPLA